MTILNMPWLDCPLIPSAASSGAAVIELGEAIVPGNDLVGDGIGGADLGDLVVDLLHPGSERLGVAVAADVHEVDLRLIEEEVVVQRRHLEAGIERRAHRRVDLVLEHDGIAHQHCAAM